MSLEYLINLNSGVVFGESIVLTYIGTCLYIVSLTYHGDDIFRILILFA